jgi:hypothetical protein
MELDKDVNVAVRSLAARNERPEQSNTSDAEAHNVIVRSSQSADRVVLRLYRGRHVVSPYKTCTRA